MCPESIRDGTGSGRLASVGIDNRLDVSSRSADRMFYYSKEDHEAYAYYSDITPTAGADNFCYIKNTKIGYNLVVRWINVYQATGNYVDIYANMTGTPVGGTAITPTNLAVSSGVSAEGTFYEGVNITGLSGGTLLDRVRTIAGQRVGCDRESGIILLPNATLVLTSGSSSYATELSIGFYYEPV